MDKKQELQACRDGKYRSILEAHNLLEAEEIEIMVLNAAHIKAVPGRKTDVKDSEWIAELLQHGLLKGSYVPKMDQRELREMVRYRRSMVQVGKHQKMIIRAQLEHIDFLTQKIEELDKEVEERMRPFEESLILLDGMPVVELGENDDST